MASGNRKKKFLIKFELSPFGLLSVGVVCFCVFLWMFLLGVWAGQTVLSTGTYGIAGPGKDGSARLREISPKKAVAKSKPPVAAPKPAELASIPQPAFDKPEKTAPAKPALAGAIDSSYFTVQVGAYLKSGYAEQALKEWLAKGYQAFSRPPEGQDDKYVRVYVGRFEEVAEARKQAEALERHEKIKPFIATIPAGSGNNP
jgi:hypothetical protein